MVNNVKTGTPFKTFDEVDNYSLSEGCCPRSEEEYQAWVNKRKLEIFHADIESIARRAKHEPLWRTYDAIGRESNVKAVIVVLSALIAISSIVAFSL